MSMVKVSVVTPPRPDDVPRDGWGRPLVVPEGGGTPIGLTRTTTFIDCIEDKSAIANWGKRMVLVGLARKPELAQQAVGLDPKDPGDKKKLDAIAEHAFNVSGANDKREQGTNLHSLSELTEAGQALPESVSAADLLDMAAYTLARMDFEPVMTEQFVVCSELAVGGTPDRVDRYTGPGPLEGMWFEDEPLITDLKTGSTEYGGLKMAAQLGIYSRAKVYDHTRFPVEPVDNDPDGKKALAKWKKIVWTPEQAAAAYTSLPPVNQEWGVIFGLPSGSGECELFWVDLTLGWEAAKLAQTIRTMRSRSSRALSPWRYADTRTASSVA